MVDTGMGRLGMTWDSAPQSLAELAGIAGIEVNGICSHFASSDSPDRARADEQAERFAEVLRRCADTGLSYRIRHISNSGGILLDNNWDYDAVRAGIHLYGYTPRRRGARAKSREPVLTSPILQWKTRVAQVRRVPAGFSVSYDGTHVTSRPTTLAVISAGYSDGYPRLLSNRASVLIGGRRCPVAGRVTMNLTVVDAGPDADVREGEEAVLLGQQGQESVWADELARMAETIPYEILTGIRIRKTVVKGA